MSQSNEEILKSILDSGVKKVKVGIIDVDGILRGKYIHIDKFRSAAESGFGFCNVVFGWDSADECYDRGNYTGWHTGYPDALAKIDLQSIRYVPWDRRVPFFLADFYEEDGHTPLNICPRQVYKRILADGKKLGYGVMVGSEFEWFNFRESSQSAAEKGYQDVTPLTPGMFGYSVLRASENAEYFNDLMDLLGDFDLPLEGLHTETGPGVFEAAIQCSQGLLAGDRAALFKTSVKEIARKHGITPTFMARWNNELPGSSGHLHQSLVDDSGKNAFYDEKDSNGMSSVFRSYLAGLIRYLPEVLVMVAPTVNSYKRLVKGFWAPTSATWGVDNRTVAFRVLKGGIKSTRVEVRVPGADINPYLAMSATVAAGLKGVKDKLELRAQPIKGNGYDDKDATAFASDLKEAAEIFKHSEFAKEAFGQAFVEHFYDSRMWEWEEVARRVSSIEVTRYFEII